MPATSDVLQPGQGPRYGLYVPARPDTVSWGWVRAGGTPAVATLAPGDLVTIDTISHEGILADQGRDPVTYFTSFGVGTDAVLRDAIALAGSTVANDPAVDGPHVITGPIWVEGAEPGDLLTVEVVDLIRRVPYGIISNRHRRGALPDELPEAGATGSSPPRVVSRFATVDPDPSMATGVVRATGPVALGTQKTASASAHPPSATVHAPGGAGLRLPLRPFLGLVAVAPAGGDAHSVPPGPHGGNLDVRLLGEGSRIHLPVRCEGALLQVGDPHFAQGDGEVALTALEGSLRAVLRVHLAKGACPSWDLPYGETDDAWIVLGLHEDLDEAVRIATRAALALVTERTGIDRATAYAWMSAAADLSISQVVDGVKGVHFSIPKAWMATIWRDDSRVMEKTSAIVVAPGGTTSL